MVKRVSLPFSRKELRQNHTKPYFERRYVNTDWFRTFLGTVEYFTKQTRMHFTRSLRERSFDTSESAPPPRGGGARQNQKKHECCKKTVENEKKNWKFKLLLKKSKALLIDWKRLGKEELDRNIYFFGQNSRFYWFWWATPRGESDSDVLKGRSHT